MIRKVRAVCPGANIVPIDYDPSATKVNQENRIKLMLAVANEEAPVRAVPGFIRAEVISFDDLMACGTMAAAKEKGLVRSEGKEYVMQDGDIVLFRFNSRESPEISASISAQIGSTAACSCSASARTAWSMAFFRSPGNALFLKRSSGEI